MEEQLNFYQQMIDSQLLLREKLQLDHSTHPTLLQTIPNLLDLIDEQVYLLNQMMKELKELKK